MRSLMPVAPGPLGAGLSAASTLSVAPPSPKQPLPRAFPGSLLSLLSWPHQGPESGPLGWPSWVVVVVVFFAGKHF